MTIFPKDIDHADLAPRVEMELTASLGSIETGPLAAQSKDDPSLVASFTPGRLHLIKVVLCSIADRHGMTMRHEIY